MGNLCSKHRISNIKVLSSLQSLPLKYKIEVTYKDGHTEIHYVDGNYLYDHRNYLETHFNEPKT